MNPRLSEGELTWSASLTRFVNTGRLGQCELKHVVVIRGEGALGGTRRESRRDSARSAGGEGAEGRADGVAVAVELELHAHLITSLPLNSIELVAFLVAETSVVLGHHLLNDSTELIHRDGTSGTSSGILSSAISEHVGLSGERSEDIGAEEGISSSVELDSRRGTEGGVVRDGGNSTGVAKNLPGEIADDEVLERVEVSGGHISNISESSRGLDVVGATLGLIISSAGSDIEGRLEGGNDGGVVSTLSVHIEAVFRRILDVVHVGVSSVLVERREGERSLHSDEVTRESDSLTEELNIVTGNIDSCREIDRNGHLFIPVPYILSAAAVKNNKPGRIKLTS